MKPLDLISSTQHLNWKIRRNEPIDGPRRSSLECARFAVLSITLIITLVIALREAWLTDDAFITFRVIENLFDGFGLRWNTADRVMVFTHPLWCLVLVGIRFVCGTLMEPVIWFSLLLSIIAMAFILPWRLHPVWPAVGVALLLPGSKAVAEYMTSGLENPLSFLIVGLLVLSVRKRTASVFRILLLVSMAFMTRPDLIILVAPVGLLWFARNRSAVSLGTAAALLPVALWEAFALIYYGALLPNTGPAKLGAGLPLAERVHQGLWYMADFVSRDPVGAVALTISMTILLVFGNSIGRAIGLGGALFLGYVIVIGGGFMSGRFLAVPLFACIAGVLGILTHELGSLPRRWKAIITVVCPLLAVFGIFGIAPQPDWVMDRRGVSDERLFWEDALSLSAIREGQNIGRIGWVRAATAGREREEPEVVVRASIGLYGYFCGPKVHVVDRFALADPLLSRLPARADSRPGHFDRRIPSGYIESLTANQNLLADADLASYYDTIRTVAIAPLSSAGRLRTVVAFQVGALDGPLLRYLDHAGSWHREPVQRTQRPSSITIEYFYTE